MLYSFELRTANLKRNEYVHVVDGHRNYRFVARGGHKRHVYTNIVVQNRPIIKVGFDHIFTELSIGGGVFLTDEQFRLNQGLARDRSVTYRVSVRGTPKRAIVTFPHYKGVGGWPAPYAILDSRKFDLDDTLYVSFQEPYFTMGSYFLSDNYGNDPAPIAASVIARLLQSHSLTAREATFLGSSKGANIAAAVSKYFDYNQLILCAYSTDLEYRILNTDYIHLATSLENFSIGFPDTLALLKEESNRKETHWFYSVEDQLANRGNEGLKARRLTSHPCSEEHSEVVTGQWDNIRELIIEKKK